MTLGVGALTDVQATVDRCKQLKTEHVSINCPTLPGFEENGYPDPVHLRAIKSRLEDSGLVVKDASWRLLKWPPLPYRTHSRGGVTSPEVLLNRDRRAIDAMARMIEVVGEVGITSVLQIIDIAKPIDPVQAEACWGGLIDIYRELMPAGGSERRWYWEPYTPSAFCPTGFVSGRLQPGSVLKITEVIRLTVGEVRS